MFDVSVKDRIMQWIQYKNISVSAFERKCGLSTGYVSNLKPNVNSKKFNEISEAFPDLNIEWLKTGKGDMLMNNPSMGQNGDGGVRQQGTAGHDLTQTNNSEKLLLEFIDGMKSQNKLTEKAMAQTDKVIDQMGKTINEMSEQRKLMDRLITLYENK